MSYKRCNQCKKRLSNNHQNLFCNDFCEQTYVGSSDIFCKLCNTLLGKQSVLKNRLFCNNSCHNKYQQKINLESRNCVMCSNSFVVTKSSKRKKLCSNKCEELYTKSSERNDMRMNTLIKNNLEKFGVESIFSLNDIKEKSRKTKRDKYGDQYYNNLNKGRQTKLDRYGTLDFSDKANKTKLEKYGTLNVNDKSNKTKLEKYNTLDFSDKANKTKLEKYGTLNFADKSKETIKQKYGSYSSMLLKPSYKRLKEKHSDSVEFLFSEDDYLGVNHYKKYNFRCLKCNNIFVDDMCNGSSPTCRTCNPINSGISFDEKEIVSYIKTIYCGNILENDRIILDGKEIDVFLPQLNFGIECDGIYWHSELSGGKDKQYHLNKTQRCLSKNINLIHIWDWEWNCKQDIIKSILSNKVGKSKKVYARKCVIREVNNKDKSTFLINNHIQGDDTSSIRLGLYYEDDLISLMTFVKSRYDKKYEYELSRYCNLIYTNIIGGASKLFNHFINNYNVNSIVTYSDKRLFTGKVYEKIGMGFVNNTPPGYHYFHKNKGIPLERTHFQKHKLSEKLEKFDVSLSEWENMKFNEYDRIWDCGHLKYEWIK